MYDDAQAFFEQSIVLGPNLVEAYFEYGHACWLGGKREKAIEIWTQGAAVNKYNPWSKRCEETLSMLENGEVPTRTQLNHR
jgi:hypothetical protein